jgi:hypothetical protein
MSQAERQKARTEALANVAEAVGRATSGRAERDNIRAELGLPTSSQVRGAVIDTVARAAGYRKKRKPKPKPKPSRNEAPDPMTPPTNASIGKVVAAAAAVVLALVLGGKRGKT